MKADLTRNTFNPLKHFTRVLMQQGRVQLDADWNEQAAILLKYLQSLAGDLIGPHGGPIANLGFRIADSNITTDFAISPGHYYVGGVLCELTYPSAPIPITIIKNQPKPQLKFNVPARSVSSLSQNQQALLVSDGASSLTTIQTVTPEGLVTVETDVNDVLISPNPRIYPGKPITFFSQADYPVPAGTLLANNALIYLDVWERLITYVEDDSIREVALNGADTAARSKLVCQVKQWPEGTPTSDLQAQFQPANRGRLIAQAQQTSVSADPCVIPPDASYRGPENQLYRIEIHTGGAIAQRNATPPSFKWSRENGSVVFPIANLSTGSGTTTVVLENLGRDDRFGLNENDWVEIQDDDYVLQGRAEPLVQVQSIASGSLTVILSGVPGSKVGQDPTKHPLLRRWDQTFGDPAQGGLQPGPDNAAMILEVSDDSWLSLENGIQIQFNPAAPHTNGNQYRTGDYWLIPARTATGDVLWPTGSDGPLALPPDGVNHQYAPLAVIAINPSSIAVTDFCQHGFDHVPYV